jgi:tetratricopeptide (TPR) repeat protein
LLETLGSAARVAEKRSSIKEAAEGNPLFLEQMVGWLAEDRPPETDSALPPTIQAVLAARLERLGPGERAVLERAAIVGKEFRQDELLKLLPPEARPTAPRHLQTLVRKQFVRPAGSEGRVQEAFRFRHILIRDATYRGIPKELRAGLHERFADWLERESGERIAEVEEIAAYHLEQAYRHRKELAPSDPRADVLAEWAGERLAAAGSRAVTRADVHAAASLLGRAASLLPRLDPRRVALLPDLGESLAEAGRLEEGRAVLHEAAEVGSEVGNVAAEWRARAADGWWRLRVDFAPAGEIGELAQEAIDALEQIGDESGLAHAWRLLGDVHLKNGDYGGAVEALARAFEHAGRAGNRHERFASLSVLGVLMFVGPTPANEGIRRLNSLREEVGDEAPLEAALLRALGGFHALRGEVDEGRRLVDRSRAILEDLGFRWALAAICFVSTGIERLAGDLEAAEREARKGVELWSERGERGAQSDMLSALAEILYEQGRYPEAAEVAAQAFDLAAPTDDLENRAFSRAARAQTLARQGELEEGERLAHEAVVLTEDTDGYAVRTAAILALAEVLELAGRAGEAVPLAREALRLSEVKGDVISARRTRERLARLEHP